LLVNCQLNELFQIFPFSLFTKPFFDAVKKEVVNYQDRNLAKFLFINLKNIFWLRNGTSNHRANDVLVKDGNPQNLTARFSYGPLDMSALSGERVDIHIMKEPPSGW